MLNFLKETAEYPSDNWNLVGSTVLTGLVVVFIALVLLIAAFWLIGVFFSPKKPQKAEIKEVAPPPVLEPAETETQDDVTDNAVIAVIAAAIAAYGAAEGKTYRINSVRMAAHTMRKPWNAAGITENMRGF